MMKHIFFFILCFVVFSCRDKNRVPPEIIGQKEMQSVLWDVIRAQILSLEMAHKDSSINEIAHTKTLTKRVFEIHKITAAEFEKSYNWYTNHPDLMRIIFDSLSVRKQKENDLQLERRVKPVKKVDSL